MDKIPLSIMILSEQLYHFVVLFSFSTSAHFLFATCNFCLRRLLTMELIGIPLAPGYTAWKALPNSFVSAPQTTAVTVRCSLMNIAYCLRAHAAGCDAMDVWIEQHLRW